MGLCWGTHPSLSSDSLTVENVTVFTTFSNVAFSLYEIVDPLSVVQPVTLSHSEVFRSNFSFSNEVFIMIASNVLI